MDRPSTSQTNILIVDDSPANLRLLALMLSAHGHRVRIAEDGPRALESVKASPPDLIMLDVMMPAMNGYEVCKQLKADPSTQYIPIIFISALDDTQNKINAFAAGGVDYVSKPFQVDEVLSRVETHLALGELRKQLQAANAELAERVAARTAKLVALNTADQRFVPLELLELLHKPNIGEVRLGDYVQQDMTILVSAIESFTTRAERMPPQDALDLVNGHLAQVTATIRQHQGIIDKYQVAGVTALFPDVGAEALQAAIAIQRAMPAYNQQLVQGGIEPITVRIGLHTGVVRLGVIGDDQQMQGTVLSDAANLATRLEGLCEVYGALIIASSPTIERLPDPASYQHRFLDRVQLSGEETPVAVYEVFDAEAPAAIELKCKTLTDFQKGVELYYSGYLEQACTHFNRVLEQNPDDQAAQCYVWRTAHSMQDFAD